MRTLLNIVLLGVAIYSAGIIELHQWTDDGVCEIPGMAYFKNGECFLCHKDNKGQTYGERVVPPKRGRWNTDTYREFDKVVGVIWKERNGVVVEKWKFLFNTRAECENVMSRYRRKLTKT